MSPSFIIEGNDKVQVGVSRNKNTIFITQFRVLWISSTVTRWSNTVPEGCQAGLVGSKQHQAGSFWFVQSSIIISQPDQPFPTKLTFHKKALPLGHRFREGLQCPHTSKSHSPPSFCPPILDAAVPLLPASFLTAFQVICTYRLLPIAQS